MTSGPLSRAGKEDCETRVRANSGLRRRPRRALGSSDCQPRRGRESSMERWPDAGPLTAPALTASHADRSFSKARFRAIAALPLLLNVYPADKETLLAGLESLARRENLKEPNQIFQRVLHEIRKVAYAFPGLDDAEHMTLCMTAGFSHRDAIIGKLRAALTPADAASLSDRRIAKAFRRTVAECKKDTSSIERNALQRLKADASIPQPDD